MDVLCEWTEASLKLCERIITIEYRVLYDQTVTNKRTNERMNVLCEWTALPAPTDQGRSHNPPQLYKTRALSPSVFKSCHHQTRDRPYANHIYIAYWYTTKRASERAERVYYLPRWGGARRAYV